MRAPVAGSAPLAQQLGDPLAVAGHVAHVAPVEGLARVRRPRGGAHPVLLDLDPELVQEGEDFVVSGVVGGGGGLRAGHDTRMRRGAPHSKAIRVSGEGVA